MKLHVLGAGTPDPKPDRFGTAFVLEVGGDFMMVDCGPAATLKVAQAGLRPTQVGWLFFTHHHFDHNVDYPCFLLSRWDQGADRVKNLTVAGPPPTALITERLVGPEGAFVDDWRARVEHPVSQRMYTDRGGVLPRPAPAVDVREVDNGDEIHGSSWVARVVGLTHGEPWLRSVGYRIESDEGVAAFTGDAGPDGAMVELARDADVLVVACAYNSAYAATHPEVPPMITGTEDAGRVAERAGAKLTVLTHSNQGVASPEGREGALAEVRRHYAGQTVLADELTCVEVPGP